MTCKDNCARCCCCGSKELREMPGYFEDIIDPNRSPKARITWEFPTGFFAGLKFYLERVPYLVPFQNPPDVDAAHTDRICLLEYRAEQGFDYGYDYGYHYEGYPYEGYNCLSGPMSDAAVVSPWKIIRDSVCSGTFSGLPICKKIREFARIRAVPCEMVLNVMRCRKDNEACTYDPPYGQIDTCAYLITARMKFVFVVETATYTGAPTFTFPDGVPCSSITLPTVDEVYTFNSGASPSPWATSYSAVQEFQVARSLVEYTLKTTPGSEDIFFRLSAPKNMPECCTYWDVPVSNKVVDGAAGPVWMDSYFKCTADPDVNDIEVELLCPDDNDPFDCIGLGSPYTTATCVSTKATFPIDLGEVWEYYPT